MPKLEPEIRGGDGAVGEVGDFDEFVEGIWGAVYFVEEDVAGIGLGGYGGWGKGPRPSLSGRP